MTDGESGLAVKPMYGTYTSLARLLAKTATAPLFHTSSVTSARERTGSDLFEGCKYHSKVVLLLQVTVHALLVFQKFNIYGTHWNE